jgi:hypothetical protein
VILGYSTIRRYNLFSVIYSLFCEADLQVHNCKSCRQCLPAVFQQEDPLAAGATRAEVLLEAPRSGALIVPRDSHRSSEGGLAGAAIPGATRKPRRLAEGGIDVACSQARNKQVQYLNAQQARLKCEIEKEFLSGYHTRQNCDDLSDLAPVEVTNPELQPVIVDEMLMLLSISGSANLQHRLRSLCRKFHDIFSSTICELPAVVPPYSCR